MLSLFTVTVSASFATGDSTYSMPFWLQPSPASSSSIGRDASDDRSHRRRTFEPATRSGDATVTLTLGFAFWNPSATVVIGQTVLEPSAWILPDSCCARRPGAGPRLVIVAAAAGGEHGQGGRERDRYACSRSRHAASVPAAAPNMGSPVANNRRDLVIRGSRTSAAATPAARAPRRRAPSGRPRARAPGRAAATCARARRAAARGRASPTPAPA